MGGEPLDFAFGHRAGTAAHALPFGFDLAGELRRRQILHEDLDPRLVDVVAPTMEVVDAQDGVEIVEKLSRGQELADRIGEHWRAALTAADQDAEADLAMFAAHRLRADVVDA